MKSSTLSRQWALQKATAVVSAALLLHSGAVLSELEFSASSPLGSVQWNDVGFADGQYVVVGGDPASAPIAAYSNDGETWQFGNVPGGSGLTGVSFATDTWVAVGYAGTVLTSPDGINWVSQSSGLSAQDHILDVACSNNQIRGPVCVFGGQGEVGGPNDQTLLYLSEDRGVSWSQQVSTPVTSRLSAAGYGDGSHLVAGDQDTIARGVNNRGRYIWTTVSTGTPTTEHFGLTFGNGTFVSAGRNASLTGSGEISVSDSSRGDSWSRIPSVNADELYAVGFGADRFLAVGRNGFAVVSLIDGKVWDPVATGTTSNLNGVTFGSGQIVAVGENGVIARAPVEESVLPVDSGTIRDLPVDGSPDVVETDPQGGIFGLVTNHSNFVDVFAAEFDLASIGGPIESATIVFNFSGFNSAAINGLLLVDSYPADGAITLQDFSPGMLTRVADLTIPPTISSGSPLSFDVTSVLASATGSTIGFRFSLAQPSQVSIGTQTIDGDLLVPRLSITRSSNEPPTADAGQDQSVRAPATVQLLGSAFDDNTPATELTYSWSVVSAPAGSAPVIADAASAETTIEIDLPGIYELQFTATDAERAESAPDTSLIGTDNLAPTAIAGADQMVVTGGTVNLDGSESTDPENDSLGFSWTLMVPTGSSALLANDTAAMPSFVPDVPGTYEAILTVSDAIGPGAPDSAVIVASSPEDFAQTQIQMADSVVTALDSSQVTTAGNQNALSNFLLQSAMAVQEGSSTQAIDKLEKAGKRTDGCIERGSPDGNGPGRDWITDCQAQFETYEPIESARDALSQ